MVQLYLQCGKQDKAEALLMRMEHDMLIEQEDDARQMAITPPIDSPLTIVDIPTNNDDEDSTESSHPNQPSDDSVNNNTTGV